MERIALAREYRVAQWLRDAYLELTQNETLDFEELRPATIRDWETLARISQVQMKVKMSPNFTIYQCPYCHYYLNSNGCMRDECRVLAVTAMVDETFRGELESLKENPGHVEPSLPCKLLISYLCPLKTILYSQRHPDS